MSLRTRHREIKVDEVLGPLREQESPRREFPNRCHPYLQLWPPSCWAESLAKAAGHLLTWPAVPAAEAPAGGPAGSAANAGAGSGDGETKQPQGRRLSA